MKASDRPIKRLISLIIFQAAICAFETYLVLRISLIGRIGIALMHREYRLLRSGWKTFFLFLIVQLIVIAVLEIARRTTGRKTLITIAAGLIVVAMCGLVITYTDFLHTYSHRLLKERFHLGFYLFWLAWVGSCIVFLADNDSNRIKREPVSGPQIVDDGGVVGRDDQPVVINGGD